MKHILTLIGLLLAACAPTAPQPTPTCLTQAALSDVNCQPTPIGTATPDYASAVITLERTPCFGACPVYKLTIYGDGTAIYEGQAFVAVEGRQTAQLSSDQVQALVEAFLAADFFALKEQYTVQVSDLPSAITSLTLDGRSHQVDHYGGCGGDLGNAPQALCELEDKIDVIVNSAQWVSAPQATPTPEGAAELRVTFERTACFGTCPMYKLTVYGDGRVVYEGIEFVAVKGRQTSSLSPAQIQELKAEIEKADFFSLEDSYAAQATDLPSAITSVTLNGRSKTVNHYGVCGMNLDTLIDPAPPALCQLEARIDEITNSAQWVGPPPAPSRRND